MVFVQPRNIPVEVPVDKTECNELHKQLQEKEKEITRHNEKLRLLEAELDVRQHYIQQLEAKFLDLKTRYDAVNEELTAIKKILSH
jgi:predicted nuclease with TOPRIM domain